MDPARWERLKSIFHAGVERTPTARQALLEAECEGDPELLKRLRAMLSAYDAGAGPLGGEGPEAVRALREEMQAALEGVRIGPYRVLRELGRGGMGAVYLAARADGTFEAQVAIKLIKRGMDSEEIVRRFFHERRILAALIHPNIARLLDGGTTSDGRPYFVLELIEGRTITRFADEEGLGVEARIRLFLPLCAAVQFAHGNLVVHRDLKPANVLVGKDGVPKLLDFGIAKLVGAAAGRGGTPTELGAPPMTPDYASPEQLAGEAVTTATDVYGLGALLFELLTGSLPKGPDGVLRLPGQAARKSGDKRLARRLSGDLDTIVARALEAEPQRRYGTPSELAADLGRHLRQEPVLARRPTFAYRCGRFVRRHKLATAAVLALVALTGFSTYQTFELARQRDRAQAERRQAEDVASFLKGLFKVADPGSSRGERVSARQVVDAAADWLLDERSAAPSWLTASLGSLSLRPATRADLLLTIGETYENLGVRQAGEQAFQRALDLYRRLPGEEASRGRARARVHLGRLADDRGDLAAAEEAHRQALAELRALSGPGAPETGEPLNGLGLVAAARGDLKPAEGHYRAAVAAQRRGGPPFREPLAESLTNLANFLEENDRAAEATPLLAEVQSLHRELFGRNHPTAADDLMALGALAFRQEDLPEAEARFAAALDLRRRMLGADHPKVAAALSNLAVVQMYRGEVERALGSAHEALALLQRPAAPPAPDLAQALINLAEVARPRETKEGALALYREALRVAGEAYGTSHPMLATLLCNFGIAQRDFGDLAEGERLIRRSLSIRTLRLGGESSETAKSWNALGTVLQRTGRLREGEAAFRQALAIRRKRLPPGHLERTNSEVGLGEVLLALEKPAEAAPLFASALEVRRAQLPPGHLKIGYAAAGLGTAYLALGRASEARPPLAEALEILRRERGAESPEALRVAALVARASEGAGAIP